MQAIHTQMRLRHFTSSAMSSSSSPATTTANVPLRKFYNGQTIPAVGLGTWRSQPGEVEEAVYQALVCGYRHIDCARIYGNENEVGLGFARAIREGVVRREDVFLTSKIWNNAHNGELARKQLDQTLKELQVEYVDLLLIHWPVNFKMVEGNMWPKDDNGHTMNETDSSVASIKLCWQAMEKFVDEGKVKSIGISNFSKEECEEVFGYARIKPVVNQIEVHPYFQQDDLIAYCHSKGMLVEDYCPLGNLKRHGAEDVTPMNEPIVKQLAEKYKKTAGQIVLRWGLQHSDVILPKTVTVSRLPENLAVADFELSAEDMKAMKELGKKNVRFVNPDIRPAGANVFPK